MGIGGEAMSWEAIRGLSKYSKLELWDSERTAKPILLNNITNAAEEAVSLLKEHDRAVELLRRLVNAYGEALKAAYYPLAVVDAKGFLHELESKQ